MNTKVRLSDAAQREIRYALEEAKKFSSVGQWKLKHMAAFCTAMAAGLDRIIGEIMAMCGVTYKVIAEWGAKKSVQRQKARYFAMA